MNDRSHENGRLGLGHGKGLVGLGRRLVTCALTIASLPPVSPALSQTTRSQPPVDGQSVLQFHPESAQKATTGSFVLIEVLRPALAVRKPAELPAPALGSRAPGDWAECVSRHGPPTIRSLSEEVRPLRHLFWPIVRNAECRHGLPRGLLDALVLAESAYRPGARSSAGARGLTQLMPATARSLGLHDHFDPASNIDGGARYLRAMIERFGGSIALGLAAYNAGPFAVRRAWAIPRNGEMPAYVERVLNYWDEANKSVDALPMSTRRIAQLIRFNGD
jgi:hypothetical protein